MSEISQERKDELISKWSHILNCPTPLSGHSVTAILIEAQEKWFTPEQVKAATPTKYDNQ